MVLLLLACAAAPPTPPGPGADVRLPVRWAAGSPLVGEAAFTLEAPAGAGTTLWADGVWWRAALTLDGEALPAVTPGPGPLEVALPALSAGAHTLRVAVSGPGPAEPKLLTLPNKNRAPRGGEWTLRLQASAALGAVAVPLVAGALAPRAEVAGAPAGATLELEVGRDGERLASWGPLPVGEALEPVAWGGGRWAVGAPELYVATATLRDAAGAVLAQRSSRVGFRETTLEAGRLALDGVVTPLWAVRSVPEEERAVAAALVQAAGLDAVELHGGIVPASWYAAFDEWGLPVVQVLRCDGQMWAPGDDVGGVLRALAPQLREQEARVLAAAASRPSLVAWSCEGGEDLRGVTCGPLRDADPLRRPVLGLDVPGVSIAAQHAPPAGGPRWILEQGLPGGGAAPPAAVAAATFSRALGAEGAGGVVPGPAPGRAAPPPPSGGDSPPPTTGDGGWAEAWAATARAAGVPAWAPGRHRAASVLRLDGLAPGQIVVLAAPGLAPVGAAADGAGVATVEAWYAGPATLRIGGGERAVELVPGQWEGTRRVSR